MKRTLILAIVFATMITACTKKDSMQSISPTPVVHPRITITKDISRPDQQVQVPMVRVTNSATVDVNNVLGSVILGGRFSFNPFGSFVASRDVKNFSYRIKDGATIIDSSKKFATVSDGINAFTQTGKNLENTKVYTFEFIYDVASTATDGGVDDGCSLDVTFYYSQKASSYDTLGPVTLQKNIFVITPNSTLETGVASTTPQTQNVFGNQEVGLLDEVLTSTGGTNTINKKTYRFADPSVSTVGITTLRMYEGSTLLGTATVSSGIATFTNTFNIATSKTITVKAVVGSVNQNLSGKNLKLISDKTEYTDAGGVLKVNDIDRSGFDQYLLRTMPDITKESVSAFTIVNGVSREYYRFKVVFPNANGSQQQFTYELSLVDPNNTDTLILKNVKIFENGIDVTSQYRITKQNGLVDTVFTESDTKLVFTKIADGGETKFQAGVPKLFSLWATAIGFNDSGNSTSVNLIGDDVPPPFDHKFVNNGGTSNSSVKLANGNLSTSSTHAANYMFGDCSSSSPSSNVNNSTPDHYNGAVTGKPLLDRNGLGANYFNN
jgi:hypothetical protein